MILPEGIIVRRRYGALIGTLLLAAAGLSLGEVRAQEGPCLGNDVCPPLRGERYVIKRGDTLESIAGRYGLTVDLLRLRNPQWQSRSVAQGGAVLLFTADYLLVGEVIWVGEPAFGASAVPSERAAATPLVLPPSQRPIERPPLVLDTARAEPAVVSTPADVEESARGGGGVNRAVPYLIVAAVLVGAGWTAYRRARR